MKKQQHNVFVVLRRWYCDHHRYFYFCFSSNIHFYHTIKINPFNSLYIVLVLHCDRLAACPWCTPPIVQWQLGLSPPATLGRGQGSLENKWMNVLVFSSVTAWCLNTVKMSDKCNAMQLQMQTAYVIRPASRAAVEKRLIFTNMSQLPGELLLEVMHFSSSEIKPPINKQMRQLWRISVTNYENFFKPMK